MFRSWLVLMFALVVCIICWRLVSGVIWRFPEGMIEFWREKDCSVFMI